MSVYSARVLLNDEPWASSSNAAYSMSQPWATQWQPIGELSIRWAHGRLDFATRRNFSLETLHLDAFSFAIYTNSRSYWGLESTRHTVNSTRVSSWTRHACPVDRSQKGHCFKLSIMSLIGLYAVGFFKYLYSNFRCCFSVKNYLLKRYSPLTLLTICHHYHYDWFTLLRLVAVNDYIFFI